MRRILPLLALLLLAVTAAVFADDGAAKGSDSKPAAKKPAAKKGSTKKAVPAKKATPKPHALIKTSMGEIEVELWPDVAPHTVAIFFGLAEGKGTFKDVKDPGKSVTIKKPFYDGLLFHRVIKDFMLQGGDPNGDGSGGAGFAFADEINAKRLGLDKLKVLTNGRPHPWLAIRSQAAWQKNVLLPVLADLKIDYRNVAEQKKRETEIKARLEALTLMQLYEMQGYKYDDTLPSVPPKKGNLALANAGPNTNSSQFFINLKDTPWLTGRHTVFGKVVKGMDLVEKIGLVPVGAGSKPITPVKILSIRRVP